MLSHHSFNVWKKYRKKKFTKNFEVKILKCTCSKFYSSSPQKTSKNEMLKKYLIIPGATGKPTGILDSLFLAL